MKNRTEMRKINFNRIYEGDARYLVSKLPTQSIMVTITSPPYWNLKNYGIKNQIGWGQEYKQYLDDIMSVFHQVYRATENSGSLWVVLDTFKTNGQVKLLPFEFADRLQSEIGWLLQDVIIWDKGKTLPWSRSGQLRNQFEYVLCFSKKNKFKYEIDRIKDVKLKEWWVKYPERYNPRGKVPSNIWSLPIPVQGSWSSNGLRHACPFPTSLVEKLILLTTDPDKRHIVLDPFAGSGIVLAMAEQMRRGFLGFELNPKFIEMYQEDVRVLVRKEWAARSNHLNSLEDKREHLENQILKLRLTKYPKILIRILQKSIPKNPPILRGILALSSDALVESTGDTKHHTLLFMKIFLIAESVKNKTFIGETLHRITAKPPLSKFGINSQISILTMEELENLQPSFGISKNEKLWLYKQGRTHKFHTETTLDKWLASIQSHWKPSKAKIENPIIASNVAVSQKIERTWQPRNTDEES